MKVEIEFITEVLGTISGNSDIATEFILSKHPDGLSKDEIDAAKELDELEEDKSTFFPRIEGKRFIWDYQIKGFFKAAQLAIIDAGLETIEDLKKIKLYSGTYKRIINHNIHIEPRKIYLIFDECIDKNKLDFLQRPCRGMTQRGERISLVRSEMAPRGTKIRFEIFTDHTKYDEWVKKWLNRGKHHGLLQWSSGGFGRFVWKEIGE